MSDIADSSNTIPRNDYRERAPAASLDRHVACVWEQRIGPGTAPLVHRIVPDGCVDIVWMEGGLHVAGPDTGPVLAPLAPGSLVVGIRFRPGLAPTMLGLPAAELIDDRVDLDSIWGRATERLAERLGDAAGPDAAMRVLERELVERLPAAAPVDPLAEAVVAELRAGPATPVVAKLAAALGTSERQLHRRCLSAFGYGPKTLDRVLRFQRFLAMARSPAARGHGGLAQLAADAGYADQAHLARECRILGGLPPRRLLG
jgi:AraC-like DNA-binding protein